ncbi:MAG: tRNA dihydrouridine synthase DusB [Candidatus Omnitrophica bacterium]|nr:tRNA dihydrouridine synthase DusB [Candidatus Omnitrophota bacterium]
MLKIGRLNLGSSFVLAPMAGISDLSFRLLNRKFGCGLAFVEMINCRSVSHKSKRTQKMLSSDDSDRPLGVQLLGCEEEYVKKALDVVARYKFDILDFNAACPAKKVVRRQEGASLMRDPKKLNKILKIIAARSKVPVTVKIRSGWDSHSENAKEVALYCQDAGVCGLFMHGRTRMQGYSGAVDYRLISEVKKSLDIPVIASGDILSPQLAQKMFDETGCDAVLIARGALGNPWIFGQIERFLKDKVLIKKPAPEQIAEVMLRHLDMCIDFYGEKNGVIIFRKFFSWYTKGFRKIRPQRELISRAKTKFEMHEAIKKSVSLQGTSR